MKNNHIPTYVLVNQQRLPSQQKKTRGRHGIPQLIVSILNVKNGGKSSVLQIFQAQKIFPGAPCAQVASSNQVLTSMGWGVQRGGGGLVLGLTGTHPPWMADTIKPPLPILWNLPPQRATVSRGKGGGGLQGYFKERVVPSNDGKSGH